MNTHSPTPRPTPSLRWVILPAAWVGALVGIPGGPAVHGGLPAVGVLGTTPLEAQEVTRPLPPPALRAGAGWLGIGFEATRIRSEAEAVSVDTIRVGQVIHGSPAEVAGVRPGDLVTHLQGEPATPEALRRHVAALEPGTRLRLRVLREGEALDLTVEAGARPDLILDRPSGEVMVLFLDSLRTRMHLHADSIRSYMMMNLDSLRTQGFLLEEEARWFGEESRRRALEGRRFEFEVRRRSEDGREEPSRIIVRAPGTPLGPVVGLGQRVVAGAEVTPLNPELGGYFGTDQGVLVTQVVEGSPAHAAGLQPGDVVVEVAGEGVRSVPQLRSALERGYRAPPVPVRILRERRELTLEFRR